MIFASAVRLHEPQEIARLPDARLGVIEPSEREIDAALKRSEALRPFILRETFTGQPVAQDPADEPASVLLERIREEREVADPAPKRKTARERANAR